MTRPKSQLNLLKNGEVVFHNEKKKLYFVILRCSVGRNAFRNSYYIFKQGPGKKDLRYPDVTQSKERFYKYLEIERKEYFASKLPPEEYAEYLRREEESKKVVEEKNVIDEDEIKRIKREKRKIRRMKRLERKRLEALKSN